MACRSGVPRFNEIDVYEEKAVEIQQQQCQHTPEYDSCDDDCCQAGFGYVSTEGHEKGEGQYDEGSGEETAEGRLDSAGAVDGCP